MEIESDIDNPEKNGFRILNKPGRLLLSLPGIDVPTIASPYQILIVAKSA